MKKLTEENEDIVTPNLKTVLLGYEKETKSKKIKTVSKKAEQPEIAIDNMASKIDAIFDKSVEEIIDKTKEQKTVEPKKDNMIIWLLVGLLVAVLIAYLMNLRNEKAE